MFGKRGCRYILATVLLTVVMGCSDDGPERVEVRGNVTLDGQPLSRGAIVFVPMEGTCGPKSAAAITDGEFRFEKEIGPPVGRLRVVITNTRPPEHPGPPVEIRQQPEVTEPAIPPKYNSASILVVETRSDATNEYQFDLLSGS